MPDELEEMNSAMLAKYGKLREAEERLGIVREGLDSLAAKFDVVSPEDVIEVAGKLVAAGLEPVQVAGLLSDMPDNSEALQEWVNSMDQGVQQREAQLKQVTNDLRHQMGVVGLRMLTGERGEAQQNELGGMPGAMPQEATPMAPLGSSMLARQGE